MHTHSIPRLTIAAMSHRNRAATTRTATTKKKHTPWNHSSSQAHIAMDKPYPSSGNVKEAIQTLFKHAYGNQTPHPSTK